MKEKRFRKTMLLFRARLKRIEEKIVDPEISESTRNREKWILNNLKDKRELYLRQRGKCCFCNEMTYLDMSKKDLATFEHVKCKSHGGPNHKSNYKISCFECNSRRGTIDFDKFMETIVKHGKTVLHQKKTQKARKLEKRKYGLYAWALKIYWNEMGLE
jgi:5-methylcytosine-specific restriction endonuclease McrA